MSSKFKLQERPSDDEQRQLFNDVYSHVMAINLPWEAKYAGFERILYDSKRIDHWRPIGITADALTMLADEGFPSVCKGLVRGHVCGRKQRAKMILDVAKPLPDAYDLFAKHDRVVIITKAENSTRRTADTWSEVIPIPDTVFDYVEGYGLNYGKSPRQAFFRSLAREILGRDC